MSADTEPRFPGLATVFGLHRKSLELYGGRDGLRDEGAIDSALASARNAYFYGGGDVYDIAEAQAFPDGPKRTAAGCALTLLRGCGIAVPRDRGELYAAMIAIARREMDKAGLAAVRRKQFPRT